MYAGMLKSKNAKTPFMAISMKNVIEESAFSITELRSCFTYTEKVNKDVIPIVSNVPVAIIHLEGEDNSYR